MKTEDIQRKVEEGETALEQIDERIRKAEESGLTKRAEGLRRQREILLRDIQRQKDFIEDIEKTSLSEKIPMKTAVDLTIPANRDRLQKDIRTMITENRLQELDKAPNPFANPIVASAYSTSIDNSTNFSTEQRQHLLITAIHNLGLKL